MLAHDNHTARLQSEWAFEQQKLTVGPGFKKRSGWARRVNRHVARGQLRLRRGYPGASSRWYHARGGVHVPQWLVVLRRRGSDTAVPGGQRLLRSGYQRHVSYVDDSQHDVPQRRPPALHRVYTAQVQQRLVQLCVCPGGRCGVGWWCTVAEGFFA